MRCVSQVHRPLLGFDGPAGPVQTAWCQPLLTSEGGHVGLKIIQVGVADLVRAVEQSLPAGRAGWFGLARLKQRQVGGCVADGPRTLGAPLSGSRQPRRAGLGSPAGQAAPEVRLTANRWAATAAYPARPAQVKRKSGPGGTSRSGSARRLVTGNELWQVLAG
jgi:hypothetical protein